MSVGLDAFDHIKFVSTRSYSFSPTVALRNVLGIYKCCTMHFRGFHEGIGCEVLIKSHRLKDKRQDSWVQIVIVGTQDLDIL